MAVGEFIQGMYTSFTHIINAQVFGRKNSNAQARKKSSNHLTSILGEKV